jgi:rubrerythrin
MPSGQQEIDSLKSMLFGEHMAINSYQNYINNTNDPDARAILADIMQEHKRHALDITNRLTALGYIPDEGLGIAGMMSGFRQRAELPFKDDSDIISEACTGEDKGIAMAEGVVRGDLDGESLALVQRILSEDRQHVEWLNSYGGQ